MPQPFVQAGLHPAGGFVTIFAGKRRPNIPPNPCHNQLSAKPSAWRALKSPMRVHIRLFAWRAAGSRLHKPAAACPLLAVHGGSGGRALAWELGIGKGIFNSGLRTHHSLFFYYSAKP